MKIRNYKEAAFNAASQLFAKLTLAKLQASRANKAARQERALKRRQSYWRASINGERECKRRRQQMAYDAGLADRRALPR